MQRFARVLALSCGLVACGASEQPPVAPGFDASADSGGSTGEEAQDGAGRLASPDAATEIGDADKSPEATTAGEADATVPTGDASADPTTLCPDIEAALTHATCYSSACIVSVTADCPTTLAPVFSAAFGQALHECAAQSTCLDVLDPSSSCMADKVRSATPTAAQQTLADDFCPACAQSPSTLQGGLSCVGHVLSPGSTGTMLSTSLLELSDAYIEKVYAAGCIGMAVNQYPSDYDNCESVFLNCVSDQFPSDPSACMRDP